ncbi:hypothetical protein DJ73_04755 [Halorubrum sp. Ea1]|nr:hypothetical protein DJ73_04755 [Halorubrum sp. Ea1]
MDPLVAQEKVLLVTLVGSQLAFVEGIARRGGHQNDTLNFVWLIHPYTPMTVEFGCSGTVQSCVEWLDSHRSYQLSKPESRNTTGV